MQSKSILIIAGLVIASAAFSLTLASSENDVMCILEDTEFMKETIPSDSTAKMNLPFTISRKAVLDSATCRDVVRTIKGEKFYSKLNKCQTSRGNSGLIKVFIGNKSYEATLQCFGGSTGLFDKQSSEYTLATLTPETNSKIEKIRNRMKRKNSEIGEPAEID